MALRVPVPWHVQPGFILSCNDSVGAPCYVTCYRQLGVAALGPQGMHCLAGCGRPWPSKLVYGLLLSLVFCLVDDYVTSCCLQGVVGMSDAVKSQIAGMLCIAFASFSLSTMCSHGSSMGARGRW
jgi:hypothetical protein